MSTHEHPIVMLVRNAGAARAIDVLVLPVPSRA